MSSRINVNTASILAVLTIILNIMYNWSVDEKKFKKSIRLWISWFG